MIENKSESQSKDTENIYENIFFLEKDISNTIEKSKKNKRQKLSYKELEKFFCVLMIV